MLNTDLHEIQFKIFTKLITKKGLRFNQLLIENVDSELVNCHLKRLVSMGLVKKVR